MSDSRSSHQEAEEEEEEAAHEDVVSPAEDVMERPNMEQWYLESQALNISTNYELVVFAMAMFSQQTEGGATIPAGAEWTPGTFRSLDHNTLLETCAIEAMQEW